MDSKQSTIEKLRGEKRKSEEIERNAKVKEREEEKIKEEIEEQNRIKEIKIEN